jgi:serine acetyltransferase
MDVAPARAGLAIIKKVFTLITHIGVDQGAQVGSGLIIPHCGPIRVHSNTKIGADCALLHVASIGAGPHSSGAAVIGDHVYIGCHSSITGEVTVDDNAVIASNSLVISDVPAGATAIGVPARSCREVGRWVLISLSLTPSGPKPIDTICYSVKIGKPHDVNADDDQAVSGPTRTD